jgi:hypothetical protein
MKVNVKNMIAVILLLICGIVIGAGGMLLVERTVIKRAIENPHRARIVLVRRLSRQYHLSREQKESVAAIIADEASRLAEVRMKVAPEVEEILSDARQRIGDELDDSQRALFEKNFDKWLERFKRVYYAGTGVMRESD